MAKKKISCPCLDGCIHLYDLSKTGIIKDTRGEVTNHGNGFYCDQHRWYMSLSMVNPGEPDVSECEDYTKDSTPELHQIIADLKEEMVELHNTVHVHSIEELAVVRTRLEDVEKLAKEQQPAISKVYNIDNMTGDIK